MNIQLHIERIVIEGISLDHQQRDQLATALRMELTQLLDASGMPQSLADGGNWARMPAQSVHCQEESMVELGRQIARAVFGGFGHE